jgi:hypothetical protein
MAPGTSRGLRYRRTRELRSGVGSPNRVVGENQYRPTDLEPSDREAYQSDHRRSLTAMTQPLTMDVEQEELLARANELEEPIPSLPPEIQALQPRRQRRAVDAGRVRGAGRGGAMVPIELVAVGATPIYSRG